MDIRVSCSQHIEPILEDFSFKNKEDSFKAFAIVIKFARDMNTTCDNCNQPAVWCLTYPEQPEVH